MVNSSTYFILRRKPLILYKILPLLLCIFILISLLDFNRKQVKLRIHFIKTSNYNLEELREMAKIENRDEFLEELLKQVDFIEADLSRHAGPQFHTIHDHSIQESLALIIPGLAENGTSAMVPPDRKSEAEKITQNEYLNRLLSDLIPFNRSLPDFREPECHAISYDLDKLPTMSVILIFVNEPFSLLIRTVHSIFQRTPPKLLQEVILVDDFSDSMDLNGKLVRYLATRFPLDKIRLLRLSERSGLVRARMIGAHVAIGDVVMFLDAHCEVTDYWAEPLLQRILEKRTAVVSPVVDEIDRYNFEYYFYREIYIGAFSWTMFFHWMSIPPEVEKRRAGNYPGPVRTPTIIGGLVGLERRYFWEIGSYDPGMLIWGGENLEMSFRIWQCGGSLEIIPCSRVGHVFRAKKPYAFPEDGPQNTHGLNSARMAEVWLDEYKELYYDGAPKLETFDPKWTNVSMRQAFRKRKNCKSFKWYLDNVFPEKFTKQFQSKLYGQLRNVGEDICLDMNGHPELEFPLEVYPCHSKLFASQTFFFSNKDELRMENLCAAVWPNDRVGMIQCGDGKASDRWEYRNGQLYSKLARKCIALRTNPNHNESSPVLTPSLITTLENCDSTDSNQEWKLDTLTRK